MEVVRHWRLQKIRTRLEGDLCSVCHEPTFPPKDFCENCSPIIKHNRGTVYVAEGGIIPNTQAQVEQVQN
jgi:uncharacterized OB-fold protein